MVTLLVSNTSWRDDPTSPKDHGRVYRYYYHISGGATPVSGVVVISWVFDTDNPAECPASMRLNVVEHPDLA